MKLILIAAATAVVLGVAAGAIVYSRTPPAPRRTAVLSPSQPAASVSPTIQPSPSPAATAAPSTAQPQPDFTSLHNAVGRSLVQVVASTCQGTGTGTGFWLDSKTVVTSYQSVSKAVSVAIVDQNRRPIPAMVSGADPVHGVALLEAARSGKAPALKISQTAPQKGDWVASVGYPSRSEQITLSPGRVSTTTVNFTHHGLHMKNFESLPGALDLSLGGAPVARSDGAVVGAMFAVSAHPARLFVPGDQLQAGIAAAQNSGAPEPGACAHPTGPYSQTHIGGKIPAAMQGGLMAYFGNINSANYEAAYNQGMGPSLHGGPPDWRSTYDFNIYARASKRGSQYRAWTTFDSINAAGMGPKGAPEKTCARWSLDYTFISRGDRLIINTARPHGKNSWTTC